MDALLLRVIHRLALEQQSRTLRRYFIYSACIDFQCGVVVCVHAVPDLCAHMGATEGRNPVLVAVVCVIISILFFCVFVHLFLYNREMIQPKWPIHG